MMRAQLPLGMLQEELRSVRARQSFGDTFPLDSAGLDDLAVDAMIPGGPLLNASCCPRAHRSFCLKMCALWDNWALSAGEGLRWHICWAFCSSAPLGNPATCHQLPSRGALPQQI